MLHDQHRLSNQLSHAGALGIGDALAYRLLLCVPSKTRVGLVNGGVGHCPGYKCKLSASAQRTKPPGAFISGDKGGFPHDHITPSARSPLW